MSSSLRVAALTLTLAAGLIAAGCGGSAQSMSPIGPSIGSGLSSETSSVLSDTAAFGTEKKGEDKGHGGEKGRGDDNEREHDSAAGAPTHGAPEGRRVEVNGRITAIDAAARTFNVGTAKVNVPLTATIRHGNRTFLFTDLALGDHVEAKGARNDAGVLVASEVKVEKGGHDGEDDDDDDENGQTATQQLTGAVAGLTGTCPTLTFNIGTTKVTTTATTVFQGVTCATLANAAMVVVKGTPQADGSIVATRVSTETSVKGAVSTLTGTCPTLTFNVGTTKVTTSATTTYFGVTCATIANGAMLEVEGTLQADGSVAAAHVSPQ